MPFINGVAKVTKNGVEMLDYSDDRIKLFMGVESMKHVFENTLNSLDKFDNRMAGDFERFLIVQLLEAIKMFQSTLKQRKKMLQLFIL